MPASAAMSGPTLLHVGERSPKDKKYETSEVVMAPPGTIVAPIPKGMAPTEENGIALVLAQLMKQAKGTKSKMQGMAYGGAVGEGGYNPYVPQPVVGTSGGIGSFMPAATVKPAASTGLGTLFSTPTGATGAPQSTTRTTSVGGSGSPQPMYAGSFGAGSLTSPYDPNALLGQANSLAGTTSDYRLGMEGIQAQQGIAAGQLGLGKDRLALDNQTAAQNYELGLKQLSQAFKQVQMQIAAEEVIAQMQMALGREGLALQDKERLDAWNLGSRQLDLTAMDDEFARIMRGVSEASVAGAGRVPSQDIF